MTVAANPEQGFAWSVKSLKFNLRYVFYILMKSYGDNEYIHDITVHIQSTPWPFIKTYTNKKLCYNLDSNV